MLKVSLTVIVLLNKAENLLLINQNRRFASQTGRLTSVVMGLLLLIAQVTLVEII